MNFRAGEIVLCIDGKEDGDGDNPLRLVPYVIRRIDKDGHIILYESATGHPQSYSFYPHRFIKVDSKLINLIMS